MIGFLLAALGFVLYFGPITFAALTLLRFCFWLDNRHDQRFKDAAARRTSEA